MQTFDNVHLLEKNTDYYEFIDSMLNGYAVNKIILDDQGEPVNYRFLEVNNSFEALSGLVREDILGKNVRDVLPHTSMEWIKLCGEVALNHKDLNTEYYSTSLKRFYNARIKSYTGGIFAIVFNDITALKEANFEAQKKQELFETLFNNIQVGLIRTSIDEKNIIKANPACAEIFGFNNLDFFMKSPIIKLYKDLDERKKYHSRLLRNGTLNHVVLQMRKANKKPLSISVSSALHFEDGVPVWIDSTIQDISRQQRAEERLEMNSVVFEHTLEAVVISDENHKILTVNKAFSDITGYDKKEVIGKGFKLLWCDEESSDNYDLIQLELNAKGFWQGEVFNRHKNGSTFPTQLSVIEGKKTKGSKYYISVFSDITYRKQSEEKLYMLAHYDSLTSLPNRYAFTHRLQESLENAKRYGHKCALFFLDLDGFKAINDTYGHNSGDEVLVTIATRLSAIIRKSDMAARMGGDEFTVIIENASDTRSLNILAQKIIKAVSEPIHLNNVDVHLTTSIGISIYPDDATDLECILKHADNAMYRAKELGKNNLQFFTKELNIDSVNQMIYEMELRHALEKDEMHVYYQPRVSLRDGDIIGFEALLYWENETYGHVPAKDFLSLAMQSDLIYKITEWMLHEALSHVRRWQTIYGRKFSLSLSLADKYLESERCPEQIKRALMTYAFDEAKLHLQIRQNTLSQEKYLHQLQNLDTLGIKIIIDNFGRGSSSVTDLCRVPIYAFIIEESFAASTQKNTSLALEATLKLAQSLNGSIIASDIESLNEKECAETLGFEQGQGRFIHPVSDLQQTISLLNRIYHSDI